MVSRDYTKEIGLSTGEKIVPLPYAMAVVAVVIAGGWFGVSSLTPAGLNGHDVKKASAAATTHNVASN